MRLSVIPRGHHKSSIDQVGSQSPRKHYKSSPHKLVSTTELSRPGMPTTADTTPGLGAGAGLFRDEQATWSSPGPLVNTAPSTPPMPQQFWTTSSPQVDYFPRLMPQLVGRPFPMPQNTRFLDAFSVRFKENTISTDFSGVDGAGLTKGPGDDQVS